MVDNFKIIKNPIYGGLTRNLNNEEPHWEVFNVSMWKGHQAYIEIADLTNSDPAGRGRSGRLRGGATTLDLC